MRLEQLFEDAQQDKEYRDKARKIYYDILEYIEANQFQGFEEHPSGAMYKKPYREINASHDDSLKVAIVDEKYAPASNVRAGYSDTKNMIVIFHDFQKDIVDRLKYSYKSMIIHELIHYLDDRRTTGGTPSAEEDTLEDYYNNPSEFNAYYQEGISKLEDMIKTVNRIDRDEVRNRFVRLYLKDFDVFRNKMNQVFDDEFIKHLNDKMKRHLVKRLYQYYTTELNDLIDDWSS